MLAGPIISLSVTEDLALTFAGLIGKQNSIWDFDSIRNNNVNAKFVWDAKRYDIDSAINYNLTPHIKIFAGYKLQYFDIEFRQIEVEYDNSSLKKAHIGKLTSESFIHGPALGMGMSATINETYFIAGNLSFIYFIQSSMDFKLNFKTIETSNITTESDTLNLDFIQYGLNFEPSIGAKISESVIGTLGARVVWTTCQNKDDHVQPEIRKDEKWYEYLYGVFVSISYML